MDYVTHMRNQETDTFWLKSVYIIVHLYDFDNGL
jgi:hypothetical protein